MKTENDWLAPYIVKAACITRGKLLHEVMIRLRKREAVVTRQLITHLLNKFLGWGPVKIQRFFLKAHKIKLDHSTIVYALQVHKDLYATHRPYIEEANYAYQLTARIIYEPGFNYLVEAFYEYKEAEQGELNFYEFTQVDQAVLASQSASILAQVDAFVTEVADRMKITKQLIYHLIAHNQTAK